MTELQLNLLKSQLPVSMTITMSMDYPNGIQNQKSQFTRPDGSTGFIDVETTNFAFARISGTIGRFGIIINWKYNDDPENVNIDYIAADKGGEEIVPINQLKEFLLKLKS